MRRQVESAIFWLTAASAAASIVSIAAMWILFSAAILLWIYDRSPVKWPPYTLPLAVFMGASVISLMASADPSVGWHPIQKFLIFPMVLLAATFVNTEERTHNALRLLLATGTVAALLAIGQFIAKQIHYQTTLLQADDPTLLDRVTGTLSHWMTFSGVELLVWCAAVPALMVLSRKWVAAVFVVGTAIVLSNTRSVWVAAAAGFAFVAVALPRRLLATVLIPMIVVVLAASPFIVHRISMSFDKSLSTNFSRGTYRAVGLKMIKDHPLFGVGPERVDDEFRKYYNGPELGFYGHLHNNFIQIAAERGLICLGAFLWFFAELYRSLLRQLRNSDEESRWVSLSGLAALTGFMVAGLNEFNFGDSEVLVLLLFLVSVPFGLTPHVQEDPHSQQG
jgi:putative inorganic carbon (HCO3(-)) transporter